MKCSNCGLPVSKEDKVCSHCGKKPRSSAKFIMLTSFILIFLIGILLAAFWFKDDLPGISKQTAKQDPVKIVDKNNKKDNEEKTDKKDNNSKISDKANETSEKANNTSKDKIKTEYIIGENAVAKDEPKIEKQHMDIEKKEDLSNYIDDAKKTVFTISTPEMQGSGFLYDWNGAIVTNAHVVEGWTEAMVRTSDGQEFTGKVIGYSNKTDVAVIHVPELKGKKPFAVNKTGAFNIGEEIVALGSPNGQENSATLGFLTGKDRSFVIGSFVYDHLYQISAPIAPGSSGGPLVSKNSKEIIAINSAQSTTDLSIGFSIPIYQVSQLIQSWIDRPMTDHELLKQFYGEDGDFVIGEEWDKEEGYFEEGDISEEDDHYDYWEYGYDEYNKDQEKNDTTNKNDKTEKDDKKPEKDKTEQNETEKPKTDKPATAPNDIKENTNTDSTVPNQTEQQEQPTETPNQEAEETVDTAA